MAMAAMARSEGGDGGSACHHAQRSFSSISIGRLFEIVLFS